MGSIGVVGSVFVVMSQVDLGLTSVSRFDLADPAISVNDANSKPRVSHFAPTQSHKRPPSSVSARGSWESS
jgi:hypothetical protein